MNYTRYSTTVGFPPNSQLSTSCNRMIMCEPRRLVSDVVVGMPGGLWGESVQD